MSEAICTWPNGESRSVEVVLDTGKRANIIWNERIDSDRKAVTGFDESVPSEWLNYQL